MQHRRGSHSVYALQVHLVFITKYRRKVLRGEISAGIGARRGAGT